METYLSILLSVFAYIILGFLWYSPKGLQKFYARFVEDLKDGQEKPLKVIFSLGFFAAFIIGLTLNSALRNNYYSLGQRAYFMGLLWFGLVFVPWMINALYSTKNYKKVAIDLSYILVVLLVIATIFHFLVDRRVRGKKLIVDTESSLILDANKNVAEQELEDFQERVEFTSTVQTGEQVGKSHCEEGLYVTLNNTNLLLKDAEGQITNKDLIDKEVTIKGIYPYQQVFCEALTCGCEDFIFVEKIEEE